jgi:hypothetical protein
MLACPSVCIDLAIQQAHRKVFLVVEGPGERSQKGIVARPLLEWDNLVSLKEASADDVLIWGAEKSWDELGEASGICSGFDCVCLSDSSNDNQSGTQASSEQEGLSSLQGRHKRQSQQSEGL